MEVVGVQIQQFKGILEEQLEKARGSLDLVDTNLKKFVAANSVTPKTIPKRTDNFEPASGKWKIAKDNFNSDLRNNLKRRRAAKQNELKDKEPLKKIENHPKVLQCSISGPPVVADYESDDETVTKPTISSYVVAKPVIIPSRKDAASVKLSYETRDRDKRIFGALLGTLKKFRQEENQLKEKVDKKAQIEKKLEEAAKEEKERLKEEKSKLIQARKQREDYIKEVRAHLAKVRYHEEWEKIQKDLFNFIKTKAKPPIYYLPKTLCKETEEKLKESQQALKDEIDNELNEIKKNVDRILEKWNIDNLETIPDILLNAPQQDEATEPFASTLENIHATVTVKPQNSPVPSDEELVEHPPRIKKEKQDPVINDVNIPISIDGVRIKQEKPDREDHRSGVENNLLGSINVKRERDPLGAVKRENMVSLESNDLQCGHNGHNELSSFEQNDDSSKLSNRNRDGTNSKITGGLEGHRKIRGSDDSDSRPETVNSRHNNNDPTTAAAEISRNDRKRTERRKYHDEKSVKSKANNQKRRRRSSETDSSDNSSDNSSDTDSKINENQTTDTDSSS